jgi:CMP-N,N'-diacetyllegionaminic acid synthase
MSRKKIIAIISARGGSKGIPHKNIINLAGFPLIAYSIAAGRLSKLIYRVIVSTDDEKIARIARRYGAEVPFLRPKNISRDNSTDKEFFLHAINWLRKNEKFMPELIVHLRPSTPFRAKGIVDDAIRRVIRDKKATSLRSAHLNEGKTPFKVVLLKKNYLSFFGSEYLKDCCEYYNLPRQRLPQTYVPNGVVDIILPKVLLNTKLLHGDKILGMVTENVPDIDSPADLDYARNFLLNKKYHYLMKFLEKVKNAKL